MYSPQGRRHKVQVIELTDTENEQSQGDSEREQQIQNIIKPSNSSTSETSGISSEEEKLNIRIKNPISTVTSSTTVDIPLSKREETKHEESNSNTSRKLSVAKPDSFLSFVTKTLEIEKEESSKKNANNETLVIKDGKMEIDAPKPQEAVVSNDSTAWRKISIPSKNLGTMFPPPPPPPKGLNHAETQKKIQHQCITVAIYSSKDDNKPAKVQYEYNPSMTLAQLLLHCEGSIGMKKLSTSKLNFWYNDEKLSKEVPQGYRVTIRDEDSYSDEQLSIAHDTPFIQYFNDLLSEEDPSVHSFSFTDDGIHFHDFEIKLKRTLRMPPNARDGIPLLPVVGSVIHHPMSTYHSKVPISWANNYNNSSIAALYQSEALWLNFQGKLPHKVRAYVDIQGNKRPINAVTGKDTSLASSGSLLSSSSRENLQSSEKDYLVCPPEHWLTGINQLDSISQFCTLPLNSRSRPPILQLEVTPMLIKDFYIMKPVKPVPLRRKYRSQQSISFRSSIGTEKKKEFEAIFKAFDKNHGYLDGFILFLKNFDSQGATVRDLLMPTGLSKEDLAKIWSLSSLRKTKSLDIVEFCIAKFLTEQKLKGAELPEVLPAHMVPFGYPVHPSLKQKIEEASVEKRDELKRSNDSADGSNTKTLRDIDSQIDQLGWKIADWDIYSTPEKVGLKNGDSIFLLSPLLPKKREATLSDYNIKPNTEIVLMEDTGISMAPQKEEDSNRIYRISSVKENTIAEVKYFIRYFPNIDSLIKRQASGIPESLQRLISRGVELEDDLSLEFYQITQQANLGLIISDPLTEQYDYVIIYLTSRLKGPPDEKRGSIAEVQITKEKPIKLRERVSTDLAKRSQRTRSDDIFDDFSVHKNIFRVMGNRPLPVLRDGTQDQEWDKKRVKVIQIYLINSRMYKKIVGQFIPRHPFDANKFLLEGLAWSPSFTEDINSNEEEYVSESTEDLQNLLQQPEKNIIIEEPEVSNSNPQRKLTMQKLSARPRKYLLKNIPDTIQDFFGNSFARDKSLLTNRGFVISSYASTNTVIVTHIEEKNGVVVEYPSDSGAFWKHRFPYLYCLENGTLVLYNMEQRSYEKYLCSQIQNVHSYILFISGSEVCILAHSSSHNTIAKWKLQHRKTPKIFRLEDKRRVLVPRDSFCASKDNHVLIGDHDAFQVWDLTTSTVILEQTTSETDHFFGIEWKHDSIVTWTKNTLKIYHVNGGFIFSNLKTSNFKAKPPIVVSTPRVLTDIHLDDQFLITGDVNGNVILRNAGTGQKLYTLSPKTTVESPKSLRSIEYPDRINKLFRYGKWVFVAQQNNNFNVYDAGVKRAKPAHVYFAEGAVKQMHVDIEQFTIYLGIQGSEKNYHVVSWSPHWEGFGGIDSQKKWKHQVDISKEETQELRKQLEELKIYVRELEEHNKILMKENEQLKKQTKRKK